MNLPGIYTIRVTARLPAAGISQVGPGEFQIVGLEKRETRGTLMR
jgi:hypothetical protein